MKKNITSKIFAFLALFWILAWILWTWILFIVWSWSNPETNKQYSEEELQQLINNIQTATWETANNEAVDLMWTWIIETNSWEINNNL